MIEAAPGELNTKLSACYFTSEMTISNELCIRSFHNDIKLSFILLIIDFIYSLRLFTKDIYSHAIIYLLFYITP